MFKVRNNYKFLIVKFYGLFKKSLKKLNINRDYEEVDTKIASGWYVEPIEGNTKKKNIKPNKLSLKYQKKVTIKSKTLLLIKNFCKNYIDLETVTLIAKMYKYLILYP